MKAATLSDRQFLSQLLKGRIYKIDSPNYTPLESSQRQNHKETALKNLKEGLASENKTKNTTL